MTAATATAEAKPAEVTRPRLADLPLHMRTYIRLRRRLEARLRRRSLVGPGPFFDPALFPWAQMLEDGWTDIRDELLTLLKDRESLSPMQKFTVNNEAITDDEGWKAVCLQGYGYRSRLAEAVCPKTMALLDRVPRLSVAIFSIFDPGKHLPAHRGPYNGVLRYHLGLVIPKEAEKCRIEVGGETRHWELGKSLIFDDAYRHEVWNDSDEVRVVLFLDVDRPLPQPEAMFNRLLIKAATITPYVQRIKRKYGAWEERYMRERQIRPSHRR